MFVEELVYYICDFEVWRHGFDLVPVFGGLAAADELKAFCEVSSVDAAEVVNAGVGDCKFDEGLGHEGWVIDDELLGQIVVLIA